jgi:hypothetical protein
MAQNVVVYKSRYEVCYHLRRRVARFRSFHLEVAGHRFQSDEHSRPPRKGHMDRYARPKLFLLDEDH